MIYADNAATTMIPDSIISKMLPYLRDQYGNASSQYSFGMQARQALEDSRRKIANGIGVDPREITFTSGASEANNWVLRDVFENFSRSSIHIITSAIEHHSVLNTCKALEKKGVEVTYLPVDSTGKITVERIACAIKPNTRLVSIIFANNEIGTIQPIAEIGQFLRVKNILFHTDAVQAIGHIPLNLNDLMVDFLTASAHKFNGAKGVGFLYRRKDLNISPMIFGGGQEFRLRAGTENVAGIISAGFALEENLSEIVSTTNRLKRMVASTLEGIRSNIPNVRVNGDLENCLPGIINLGFDGISGESLMHLLDLKGICVSTGSACASGTVQPSHVLIALGQTEQQAKSAIRISYGRFNIEKEVEEIVSAICGVCLKIMRYQ